MDDKQQFLFAPPKIGPFLRVSAILAEVVLSLRAVLVLPAKVGVAEINTRRHGSVFRISRLPLCELCLHKCSGSVPGKLECRFVHLETAYPEAGRAVAAQAVQVDHVSLLVKTC